MKAGVVEKADAELLVHYGLAIDGGLTNLGLLLVGRTVDRGRVGTAPIVQAIMYDERGTKVAKWTWDDYALSPVELVDAVWTEIPDFRGATSYRMECSGPRCRRSRKRAPTRSTSPCRVA